MKLLSNAIHQTFFSSSESGSHEFSISPLLYEEFSEYKRFQVECTVNDGNEEGWAAVEIVLNTPPIGGNCTVDPQVSWRAVSSWACLEIYYVLFNV